MGGSQKTPSIGFGTGTDRLVLLLEDAPKRQRPVVFVGLEPSDEIEALKLAHTLRKSGFTCESLGSGNLGKKFKKADKLKAWAVVIVGGDEKLRGEVSIKILDSGEQMSCAVNMLTNHFFKTCQNRQLEIPVA
jgi:histidyl-tRNA synthetase